MYFITPVYVSQSIYITDYSEKDNGLRSEKLITWFSNPPSTLIKPLKKLKMYLPCLILELFSPIH